MVRQAASTTATSSRRRLPGQIVGGLTSLPRRIPRLSVGAVIIAGFGTIILVLAIVVAVSAWQHDQVRSDTARLRREEATVHALDETRFDVTYANLLLQRYVLTASDNLIPEIHGTIGEAEAGITEVRILEEAEGPESGIEHNEAELVEMDAIRGEIAGLAVTAEQVIALRRGSGIEAARATLEAAKPQIERLEARLFGAAMAEQDELPALVNRLETRQATAFWLVLSLGVGGALIGLAATFVITRAIVRPVASLEAAALAVAAGDLGVRALPQGPRELARLGAAINQMTDSLIEDREIITNLAYHDALTGLPNRALLEDRADVALAQARRGGHSLVAISLDIDRLKIINDTLGHPAGDELLNAVALRLGGEIRTGDTLARMGGDEFFALLTGCQTTGDGVSAAGRMVEAFNAPLEVDGRDVRATISAGVCFFPEDGDDLKSLIHNADAAMYRAKRNGRNNYQIYDSSMDTGASERLELERDLHHALDRDQLMIHYQPQVSLETGEIVGVEALLRWQHPTRGLVPPGEFIPIAEDSGLIIRIGDWVLREACREMSQLKSQGLSPMRLAVNVSPRQFQRPDFAEKVSRTLEDTGFDPQLLELEVTENLIMEEAEIAHAAMKRLADTGIRIAIDDFGTGYSSLQHLRTLPIHVLKIDRSFVDNLATESDAAIAVSIISLAHSLKLTVVAEGVERAEQLSFLREQKCDLYQGFLHSRPMPADELLAFIKGAAEVTAAPILPPGRA